MAQGFATGPAMAALARVAARLTGLGNDRPALPLLRPPATRPTQGPGAPRVQRAHLPVMYAAADAGQTSALPGWLRDTGYPVIPVEGFGLAIGELLARPDRFSLLMIDIDGFGGPGLVVERLLDLRRRQPGLPVIVVSAEVQFNDFTAERLAICDVTLRAPVSSAALELALSEAAVNNLLWQARQSGRRGAEPANA